MPFLTHTVLDQYRWILTSLSHASHNINVLLVKSLSATTEKESDVEEGDTYSHYI